MNKSEQIKLIEYFVNEIKSGRIEIRSVNFNRDTVNKMDKRTGYDNVIFTGYFDVTLKLFDKDANKKMKKSLMEIM